MAIVDDIAGLRRILAQTAHRSPSSDLSAQLVSPELLRREIHADHGYRGHPGQPESTRKCSGERCYPNVAAIPGRVDIVDCFRKPRRNSAASRARPSPRARRCCGCSSASATTRRRAIASDAGLDVVMDRCVKIEHARHPRAASTGPASIPASSRPGAGDADIRLTDTPRYDAPCPTTNSASTRCACTPARSRTPPPARARCRSTRRRRSCSTAPIMRRACSTCRRSATSTRASRIRRSRRSRKRVAALEGGRAALAAATGMAAQMVALLTLCRARRSHRRVAHAVRRHVFAARRHVRAVRHRRHVRRRRRSRRTSGAR